MTTKIFAHQFLKKLALVINISDVFTLQVLLVKSDSLTIVNSDQQTRIESLS